MARSELLDQISNRTIPSDSAIFEKIHLEKAKNERLLFDLNREYLTNEAVIDLMDRITGQDIDPSVVISQPFYSDFGRHITFGKEIFINKNVTFIDLGGITLGNQVLIGSNTRIITVNHLVEPAKRRGLITKPVVIKDNAWLGANVTVLPGVTIGENAIIAADSTVTKDVPDNVIVAGTPAKIIKTI